MKRNFETWKKAGRWPQRGMLHIFMLGKGSRVRREEGSIDSITRLIKPPISDCHFGGNARSHSFLFFPFFANGPEGRGVEGGGEEVG